MADKPKDQSAAFNGQGHAGALHEFITTTLEGEPRPNLMPTEYWDELRGLTRAELGDVAWYLAQQLHDISDDHQGTAIELRAATDYVRWLRRPTAIKLQRR